MVHLTSVLQCLILSFSHPCLGPPRSDSRGRAPWRPLCSGMGDSFRPHSEPWSSVRAWDPAGLKPIPWSNTISKLSTTGGIQKVLNQVMSDPTYQGWKQGRYSVGYTPIGGGWFPQTSLRIFILPPFKTWIPPPSADLRPLQSYQSLHYSRSQKQK